MNNDEPSVDLIFEFIDEDLAKTIKRSKGLALYNTQVSLFSLSSSSNKYLLELNTCTAVKFSTAILSHKTYLSIKTLK